jgi:hypothetical protein
MSYSNTDIFNSNLKNYNFLNTANTKYSSDNNDNLRTMWSSSNYRTENIKLNPFSSSHFKIFKKHFCRCMKSFCSKKYCECYNNSEKCDKTCSCQNCNNMYQSPQKKTEIKQKGLFCNCSKTSCAKHYCECFKRGKTCNKLCRCSDCINFDKNDRLKMAEYERRNLKDTLLIEKISIHITKTCIEIVKSFEHPIERFTQNKRKKEEILGDSFSY